MNLASYHDFADIYDSFMLDAPYQQWMSFFSAIEMSGQDLADIGCGTGTLAVQLALRGARAVGVDSSSEMLTTASARAFENRVQVEWLCQDMRALRLPRQMNTIISTCDSLNYLTDRDSLQRAFQSSYQALKPGGRFCFDMLGPARIETLTEGVWYDIREDAELWFTSLVTESGRIDYEVHAFFDAGDGLYRRVVEQHTEQFYPQGSVSKMLMEAGFIVQSVEGDFGDSPVERADRLVFVASKP